MQYAYGTASKTRDCGAAWRPLSDLNQRLWSPWITTMVALGAFLLAVAVYVTPLALDGTLDALPLTGDAPDYDAIAYQLSIGHGFAVDWDDPVYRAPYESNNESGRYDYLLERRGASLTAFRPPLFPAVMALGYAVFGRSFALIRVFNAFFMALTGTLAALMLCQLFGPIPAAVFAILFIFENSSGYVFARQIMTEALASVFVVLIAWCLYLAIDRKKGRYVWLLGFAIGFAFLTRTIFVLWVPLITLIIFCLAKPKECSWLRAESVRLPVFFLTSFIIVSGPWMLRNCLVLKGIYPLGTQGNLAAAYSEKALQARGMWIETVEGFGNTIEQERDKSDRTRKRALDWLRNNYWKTPLLAYFKARAMWYQRLQQRVLVGFGILGSIVMCVLRRNVLVAFLGLLAANTFAVGASYSVGGRFLVPLLPILFSLAAVGVWSFLIACVEFPLERLRPFRSRVGRNGAAEGGKPSSHD